MKKLISIFGLTFLVSSNAFSAVVSCDCEIEKVYAGQVGASNSQNFSVECNRQNAENLVYKLGTADSEIAKARYSLAISALMVGKNVTVQFTDTACITAHNSQLIADGMYLSK